MITAQDRELYNRPSFTRRLLGSLVTNVTKELVKQTLITQHLDEPRDTTDTTDTGGTADSACDKVVRVLSKPNFRLNRKLFR